MKKTITIVDYGSGNLLSAQQSFVKVVNLIGVDAEIQISNNPENLKTSSHVVLPGQGAFKTCMDGIKKIPGMEDELNKFVKIKYIMFCIADHVKISKIVFFLCCSFMQLFFLYIQHFFYSLYIHIYINMYIWLCLYCIRQRDYV